MREALKELYRYRETLYMLTYRDIRVKYKQSIMGFAWAVMMPTLIVLAGIMVKYAYAIVAGRPLNLQDFASVAVKSVPWAFFVGSIRFANLSLISNSNLVTKIYFPKEIFPLAAVASQLFDLAIASLVLTVVLTLCGVGLNWHLAWVPLLLTILVLQAVATGTFVAAASLFFRDVKYIVEILLTFGIFFTPVFYDLEMFGAKGDLLRLNPVAPILEGFRTAVVLHHSPDPRWLLYSGAIGVAGATIAYAFFKRLEPRFAESI